MKSRMFLIAAITGIAAFALACGQARASASVDFQVSFGGPNSSGTLEFHSEPQVVVVPQTKVYYIRNYDGCNMYKYGRYWYFVESNRWYRARSYRGPFVYVHKRSVPRAVVSVPVRYRHNWYGPPAHAVAIGHERGHGPNQNNPGYGNKKDHGNQGNGREVAQGRGNGNSNGHGNGHGNGKD